MMKKQLLLKKTNSRLEFKNRYPIYDQNGQNRYPIYDQNGWKTIPFGAAHTCLPTPHLETSLRCVWPA